MDIEVWIQVTEPFTGTARLECRSVPERDVVMATLRGDYSQMPAVTQAIGAYIADHGLTTGPMFNIYRVSPAQNPDPSSCQFSARVPLCSNNLSCISLPTWPGTCS